MIFEQQDIEGESIADEKCRVYDPWNLKDRYTFSTAVRKGNMLFMSGITASDPSTGKIVGEGDIVEQTRYIFEKVETILKSAGASFSDVVKTTEYIITTSNYNKTEQVRKQYFGEQFPAATGIVVSGLLRDKALIEIDVVAMVD